MAKRRRDEKRNLTAPGARPGSWQSTPLEVEEPEVKVEQKEGGKLYSSDVGDSGKTFQTFVKDEQKEATTETPVQTTETEETTYDPITGEEVMQAGEFRVEEAGRELFGEDFKYSSFDEYTTDLLRAEEATQKAIAEGNKPPEWAIKANEEAQQRAESEIKSVSSELLGSREGIQSIGNVKSISAFKKYQTSRLEDYAKKIAAVVDNQKYLVVQRDQAIKQGKQQLAEQYEGALANAKIEAAQLNADLYNAMADMADLDIKEQAQKTASLESFQGLVELGTELTPEAIQGYADQLGIDFQTAYGFYTGAQAIRDDKTLDTEAKKVELDNLKYEFQNTLSGNALEQANKLDYFSEQVKSGNLSDEQIESLAVMLDIPVSQNPVYQAQLKIEQAEAKIKENQSNGIPTTATEWNAYYDAIATKNELYGTGGTAYIPNNSLEGITSEYAGGQLQIYTDTPYQCGEFVNRFWGLESGAGGGFGDTQGDKNTVVQNRGIMAEDVSINNYTNILKPGMAFVTDNNHVGIITQVLPDGRFATIEANIGDDNPNTNDVPMPSSHSIKDANIVGYAPPPGNYSVEGGEETSGYDTSTIEGKLASKFAEQATNLGYTGEEKQEFIDDQIKNSYGNLTEAQTKAYVAYGVMADENVKYNEITSGLDMEEFANSVNLITKKIGKDGLSSEAINRKMEELGFDQATRQAIMSELRWVEALLRKQSGAAIKQEEYEAYGTMYFPRAGDDEQTLADKTNARDRETNSVYVTMGPSGQRQYEEYQMDREDAQETEDYRSLYDNALTNQYQDAEWDSIY